MLWSDCKVLDTVRGRRRPRGPARKLSCSFWFLLLFGVGGLVLFIHLQDVADMVQQQAPANGWDSHTQPSGGKTRTRRVSDSKQRRDVACWASAAISRGRLVMSPNRVKFGGMTRQTREDLCSQDSEAAGSAARTARGGRLDEPSADHAVSPMPFPAFAWDRVAGTPGSREHELGPPRVTKRRRKLLKTSPVMRPPSNSSSPSSSSPPRADPPSPAWPRLSLAQEERRRLMQDVCARYRSDGSRTVTPHHVSRVYVEDQYQLLYCEVPKAGCSNWKRVLMVLSGAAPSAHAIAHDAVHYGNHLKRLDSFDRAGIAHRLRTYTKVLFVREPMERLVSAFRDKFESPNSYYHPVFGKPIISRYRANASRAALKTGSGVTFPEFIRYLLDVHRPVGMDIHWEPVTQLCSPCLLHYDFIGKFETIEEEANFLLRRVAAPRNLTFPSFKDRNPNAARTSTHMTQHYFMQLSATDRQRAYDFYYMDYLMFNYSKPFKDLY